MKGERLTEKPTPEGENRRCLHCGGRINTVRHPRAKMCSKLCYAAYARAKPQKPPAPPPVLAGSTIVLCIPSGRLRYTSNRTLWRLDSNEPVRGLRCGDDSSDYDDAVRTMHERRVWDARYQAALKYAADYKPLNLNLPREESPQHGPARQPEPFTPRQGQHEEGQPVSGRPPRSVPGAEDGGAEG
jgi:hypothetical protein